MNEQPGRWILLIPAIPRRHHGRLSATANHSFCSRVFRCSFPLSNNVLPLGCSWCRYGVAGVFVMVFVMKEGEVMTETVTCACCLLQIDPNDCTRTWANNRWFFFCRQCESDGSRNELLRKVMNNANKKNDAQ